MSDRARLSLPEWANRSSVERAWACARQANLKHDNYAARVAMRAASARDDRLLMALEGMCKWIDYEAESQFGHTRRETGRAHAETVEATEAGLIKAAYTCLDKHTPGTNTAQLDYFQYIYAGAAALAGIHRPDYF